MAAVKLEFDVELTDEKCCECVRSALVRVEGVRHVKVDLKDQSVVVESNVVPSSVIQETIEATNRRAILKGIGTLAQGSSSAAAVASLIGSANNVYGVVRFVQIDEHTCLVDGTIDGLEAGEHGLHIHEYGDLSAGFKSLGPHYNPTNSKHGSPTHKSRHLGDLGNVLANERGRATFRFENDAVKVWNIIGRSLGVTAHRDDLGSGNNEQSGIDGNSGSVIACGIIARTSGLFQNAKRICACSGLTIWDERDEATKTAKI